MRRRAFAIAGAVALALPGAAFGWSHSGAYGTASGGGGSWSASGYRGGSASGGGGSWSASGFRGGSASGGGGSWSGTGFRGGTASGSDGSWSAKGASGGTASGGDGSWSATGARGGTASGGGGSWQATGAYGTSAYGHAYYGGTYYGGTYSTYHPPTVVNSYYGSGCYDCGGWNTAGAAAVGGFLGARLAQARAQEAAQTAPPQPTYVMGGIYPTLPAGCTQSSQGGGSYYDCNGTWFSAAFGANGVYYRVVPAPAF